MMMILKNPDLLLFKVNFLFVLERWFSLIKISYLLIFALLFFAFSSLFFLKIPRLFATALKILTFFLTIFFKLLFLILEIYREAFEQFYNLHKETLFFHHLPHDLYIFIFLLPCIQNLISSHTINDIHQKKSTMVIIKMELHLFDHKIIKILFK